MLWAHLASSSGNLDTVQDLRQLQQQGLSKPHVNMFAASRHVPPERTLYQLCVSWCRQVRLAELAVYFCLTPTDGPCLRRRSHAGFSCFAGCLPSCTLPKYPPVHHETMFVVTSGDLTDVFRLHKTQVPSLPMVCLLLSVSCSSVVEFKSSHLTFFVFTYHVVTLMLFLKLYESSSAWASLQGSVCCVT